MMTYDGMISFFVLVLYFTIMPHLYLHAKMFTIALAANDGFIFAKIFRADLQKSI